MNRTVPREASSHELRERQPQRRPHFAAEPQFSREQRRLRARVAELQGKWESIRTDLPPQLSRRHSTPVSQFRLLYTDFLILVHSRDDLDWRSHWHGYPR
jgi:hypothetical protein